MQTYQPKKIDLTKYLFFTGKGGVGKTTTACATAAFLADEGKKVMLVSTDPASNLQDVFQMPLDNQGKEIPGMPNLTVANFDPVMAADDYKESVVGPYRGILPDEAIVNMEEQLSGSCTVEIASFNEFAGFLTNPEAAANFDFIIFDTAPTGHTLRMLQLPSAWSNFMDENTTGTSCMGQLSGLGDKKAIYEQAVKTLADPEKTTLILVTRTQTGPLIEAERASKELAVLGIKNQLLVVNGILPEATDSVSKLVFAGQQAALNDMPADLKKLKAYEIPLRPYNVTGLENIRRLLQPDQGTLAEIKIIPRKFPHLEKIVDDLVATNKKVVFTMGKGGVGKTTVAAALAVGIAEKGKKIHLATTDPAAHLQFVIHESQNIKMSHIDEAKELADYQAEVLAKAREEMSEEDIAYVEEDLRSPCTQEIAVFRAFAEIVADDDCDVVVIDTAPTGHTLLLLDSTQSYHKELARSSGEVPASVAALLPRLQDPNETEVVMVTLPETTPVYESIRLQEDLDRAKIAHTWWVVNNSMLTSGTTNPLLLVRAQNEDEWINRVATLADNHFVVVPWLAEEVVGETLGKLL